MVYGVSMAVSRPRLFWERTKDEPLGHSRWVLSNDTVKQCVWIEEVGVVEAKTVTGLDDGYEGGCNLLGAV